MEIAQADTGCQGTVQAGSAPEALDAGAFERLDPEDGEPGDGPLEAGCFDAGGLEDGDLEEEEDTGADEPDLLAVARPDAGTEIVGVTVAPDAAGQRLDRVLSAAIPALSRTRLQRLIAEGYVGCEGRPVLVPGMRVRAGQRLTVRVPAPEPAVPEPEPMALVILYEDDDVIVLDKPAGLVVHPGAGHRSGTLVNGLLAHCAGRLSGIGGVARPGIVHRLDQDTSGVLVVAKCDRAHRGLAEQFAARRIGRRYLAVVWGVPTPPAGEIAGRIGRDPRNRKRMAVLRVGGKPAATRYRVLATGGGVTGRLGGGPPQAGGPPGAGDAVALLECRLLTGRTHQIRVHLSSRGHPLLGDPLYRGAGSNPWLARTKADEAQALITLKRQALHAETLEFHHPVNGRLLRFSAPIPADMQSLLVSLRIH